MTTELLLGAVLVVLVIVALRIREITYAIRAEFQRAHETDPPPVVIRPGLPKVLLGCGHVDAPYALESGALVVCQACHERKGAS